MLACDTFARFCSRITLNSLPSTTATGCRLSPIRASSRSRPVLGPSPPRPHYHSPLSTSAPPVRRSRIAAFGTASGSTDIFAAKRAMATTSRLAGSRRFAPLNPDKARDSDAPVLKGIVFDVDGTLCLPQNYMFKEMRDALDIPKSVDILEHIRSLSNEPDGGDSQSDPPHAATTSDPSVPPAASLKSTDLSGSSEPPSSPQSRATEAIRAIERRAMTSQRPQPGLQDLMAYLHQRGVRKALCTRNFPALVHHLLGNFLGETRFGAFEPIITRETEGIQPKPSPEGLWAIAQAWGLDGEIERGVRGDGGEGDPLELARKYLGAGLIMVGDSIDDMAAGRRAGAVTVLLVNEANEALRDHDATDLCIDRLDELIDILESGVASRDIGR